MNLPPKEKEATSPVKSEKGRKETKFVLRNQKQTADVKIETKQHYPGSQGRKKDSDNINNSTHLDGNTL